MEYSKEDLMEAKKQIWGVGENMGTEESKKIWEEMCIRDRHDLAQSVANLPDKVRHKQEERGL